MRLKRYENSVYLVNVSTSYSFFKLCITFIYPCQISDISANIPFELLHTFSFLRPYHVKPSYFPQIFSGLSNKLIMPLHTNRSWNIFKWRVVALMSGRSQYNPVMILYNNCEYLHTENQRWNFEFMYVVPVTNSHLHSR